MKRTLVVLMLAGLLACGDDNDDDAAETPVTAADSAAATREPVFSQEEAIGVLKAIGDAEIAMAGAAREISQNSTVLSFANVVRADHQDIAELITAPARENAMSAAIRAQGDSITRAFMAMQGGFNNTYIEEQVTTHQQALQILDTAIIPSVRDSATKTLLQQLRPTFAAHLQRAMQILTQRKREAAERGEPWVSGFDQTVTPAEPAPVVPQPAPSETQPQPQPQPQAQPQRPAQQQPQPTPPPRPVPLDTTSRPPMTTTNS